MTQKFSCLHHDQCVSNILSSYLEVIADNMKGTMEVISSEDALSKIDDHNAFVGRKEITNTLEDEDWRDIWEMLKDATETVYKTDDEEFMSEEEIEREQDEIFNPKQGDLMQTSKFFK